VREALILLSFFISSDRRSIPRFISPPLFFSFNGEEWHFPLSKVGCVRFSSLAFIFHPFFPPFLSAGFAVCDFLPLPPSRKWEAVPSKRTDAILCGFSLRFRSFSRSYSRSPSFDGNAAFFPSLRQYPPYAVGPSGLLMFPTKSLYFPPSLSLTSRPCFSRLPLSLHLAATPSPPHHKHPFFFGRRVP